MSSQPLVEAAHLAQKMERSTAKLSDVSAHEFDYVLVGGGSSGLALASRLAEDASVTVAVLEAGGETHQFESITRPAQYGREHGNSELVYPYETEVQANIGRPLMWPRGRGLGGSSAVNFFVFTKPPASDIDNWEKLGNPGWNWDRYHAAVKRAETFHPTAPDVAEKFGFQQNLDSHGTSGPIQTSLSKIQTAGEAEMRQSLLNCGVKIAKDAAGGDITGLGTFVSTIDPRTNTRSYAATGYFVDKTDQPNLHVLTNATARKIIFNKHASGADIEAAGVEFEVDGNVYNVHAKREIILAAGTIRTSALLELSGIGNKDILSPLGIETLVHNPNVGENVQEHLISGVTWLLDTEKGSFQTIEMFADPAFAAEQVKLYAEGKGLCLTQANLLSWLPLSQISSSPARVHELIANAKARVTQDLASPESESGINRPGLREQYELQLKDLKDESVPDAEIVITPFGTPATAQQHPGKPAVSLSLGLSHPFSRGSIHITSADPNVNARMDPNIFDHDIDLELLVEMVRFSRRVADTEPFKNIILKEVAPGAGVVSDEDIKKFIKDNVNSTWHTAGSCALRPRDAGGVVDSSLKVYGTKNLRVGDISIIPLHIAAHTQATAYAIAEQLAEILKDEASRRD